jgi:galactokinase
MLEVQQLFRKHFGHPPTYTVQAPGRAELLGNHTDYNQGLVLALAVDRHLSMSVSSRTDGRVELVSSAFPEPEIFSVLDPARNPAAPWADYVKGVLLELRKRHAHCSGFNAAIHGTIPPGAGLSSSAALEVATALAVRELHPYTLTATGTTVLPKRSGNGALPPLSTAERIEIARTCLAAESGFVGVNCGLLDQLSSLFGKAFHAVEIDCQSLAIERVPMIGEIAIVICHSGVSHSLVGGEYNELRRHCEAAARALGAKSLRSVDTSYLAANRKKLSEREYQCAYHVVGEIQRVVHGSRSLRGGDFVQFGQFMFQSHESSRDFFRNSCAELDLLVGFARAHPACLGARLTGGGFGGATINLVHRDQVESFNRAMAICYEQRTGRKLEPMVCQAVDGAQSVR